ncbi:hypothetical protein Plec18170_002537 [Paecilomyces lecythidis]
MLEDVRISLTTRMGLKKSVAEMLLTDDQDGLTKVDVKTILGGLMSGGFETIFSTAIITIGFLSSVEGQAIQKKAYDDILSIYGTPENAFEACITEEKCIYVSALVKEALRFYPPLKLLPARQTYKDFVYQGSHIPKGVLIYVNAQAANRDTNVYGPDAGQFKPDRWIEKTHDIPPPYHFAFGAGGRMCTAVNFSNRVLYAIFLRLIVAFDVRESKISPPNIHYIDYKRDPAEANAIPCDFNVRFTPRNEKVLRGVLDRLKAQSVCVESESGAAVASCP